MSWSSGKDSAWALHVLRHDPQIELAGLFTVINARHQRVAMHAVRLRLLELQAEAAGLPLQIIEIPDPCSNEQYEAAMQRFVDESISHGIGSMAFGDLFLQDIRDYRERQLAETGISRSKLKSPWLTNATAVCLLRLGRSEQAVNLPRGLVISAGVITLRPDAPIVFKTNFATALLAHNNLDGCLSVLHEIKDEENPTVQQLRGAIRRFRESLSLWKRLQWRTGAIPNGPVAMDFPPGNLE